MVDIQCEFIPPPEAPVFEPTVEEFQDPLAYIAKIKPIAEKTGICKIKPPPNWQPPFAVNVDTFRFTPRKQRLNELEAGTRIKLNFLDRLARFWELQGNSLRIPNVERKVLDLFTLQKIVTEEGGFENVTKERRWTKIGSRLGYPSSKGVGSTLRSHYDRILYPFDLFNAGLTVPSDVVVQEDEKEEVKSEIVNGNSDGTAQTEKPSEDAVKTEQNGMDGIVEAEKTEATGGENNGEVNEKDGEVKEQDREVMETDEEAKKKDSEMKGGDGKTTEEDGKTNEEDGKTTEDDGKTNEEDGKTNEKDGKTNEEDGNTNEEDEEKKEVNATCSETGEAVKPVESDNTLPEGDDYKPHNIADIEAKGGYTRRSKRERAAAAAARIDYTGNKELKKLQFYGAGPKAATAESVTKPEEPTEGDRVSRTKSKKVCYVDLYICLTCNRGDAEEHMLLCDGCDAAYHTFCLIPPLTDIPKGDWRCPTCISEVCKKQHVAFGFEQAKVQYSLQTFGEMADQFKLDYFNMPVHMVPYSTVEKEFWRLVNCIEEDVSVEYGADIHALEMGSGFPTRRNKEILPEDEEYLDSGWNLNNLPVLGTSILKYINADVSGMKVPWCYVGMCFSSFCWHIEDHWSYSINYMHWGEPKTWYGVPGRKAELLEEVMKRNAPDLFSQSPDLLHHITTIMNPNILMAYGVPIVRTDQCAGEFIITFPRSYHAGFNQGYNFAEAVNFCPADWLAIGLECIDHYRLLKRHCVFSHEELVCKMASDPDRLDLNLVAATHQDMICMVEEEKRMRKVMLDQGITETVREAFELLSDDERQCASCCTTIFLSGVTCSCDNKRIVCLYHSAELCNVCEPSKKTLRYRYTLDELPAMLQKLKNRVECFDVWAFKVKAALDGNDTETNDTETKPDILDLRDLLTEAEDNKFPDSPLFDSLAAAIDEAEKCANVASQLITKKVRTRNRHTADGKYIAKLSLHELQLFSEQVNALPCVIKEAQLIKDLLQKVLDFQEEARAALLELVPDSQKLDKLIAAGIALDVDLQEIPQLKQVLEQARWLDGVNQALSDPTKITLDTMRKLIETGVGLAPHAACEQAMAKLQDLLTNSERIEEKARVWLNSRPHQLPETGDDILQEAVNIPSNLPNITALQDALKRAKELLGKVNVLQKAEHYPYLDVLEELVLKSRSIPVFLDELVQIETNVNAAKSWKERTARTFLKKNSTYSLYEVLSPRNTLNPLSSNKQRKRKNKDGTESIVPDVKVDQKAEENKDPAATVAAFKLAEQKEIDAMLDLRHINASKATNTTVDPMDITYCVCRKPSQGFMLQCELCRDWFHSTCVPLPKSANLKNKSSSSAMVSAAKDLKFLCPLCHRSRRPRLETILSLLVSLQKLPVRMIEGEALQCLTERGMAWQDRARQALLTEEISAALAKLSVMSQRAVEQAAREKTEKIINAELMKAANNPDLQGHLQNVSHGGFAGENPDLDSASPAAIANEEVVDSNPSVMSAVEDIIIPSSDANCATIGQNSGLASPTDMSEHAYSSMSKALQPGSPRGSRKSHGSSEAYSASFTESSLAGAAGDKPVLHLSAHAKNQLELLLMEGDLLEVSLDETQHIWKILQACQSSVSPESLLSINMGDSEDSPKNLGEFLLQGAEKKKYRKRKKDGEAVIDDLEGLDDAALKAKKKKMKKNPKDKPVKLKDLPLHSKERADLLAERKKSRQIKKVEKLIAEGKIAAAGKDSDNEDDCSAGKCLKPVGQEVNWVQCDRCELWFHLLCIGMKQEDLVENEDFMCALCRRQAKPPTAKKTNNNDAPVRKKRNVPKQYKKKASVYNSMTGLMSITGGAGTVAPHPEPTIHRQAPDTEDSDDLVIDEDVVQNGGRQYHAQPATDEIAEFPNFVRHREDSVRSVVSADVPRHQANVDSVMLDVLKGFTNKADSDGSDIVDIDDGPRSVTPYASVMDIPDNTGVLVPENVPQNIPHHVTQSIPHEVPQNISHQVLQSMTDDVQAMQSSYNGSLTDQRQRSQDELLSTNPPQSQHVPLAAVAPEHRNTLPQSTTETATAASMESSSSALMPESSAQQPTQPPQSLI